MHPILLRSISATFALCFAGCQTSPPEFIGNVVAIYAERVEAQAVAVGQFGAVPIAMAGEAEIEVLRFAPCEGLAVAVQFRAGRKGWIPMESLPQKLKASSGCSTETANPLQGLPAAPTMSH